MTSLQQAILLIAESALVLRLVLAFNVKEGGREARRANLDMVDFSDANKSLVAMPRRFDCCFVPRDAAWVESKM